MNSITHVSSFQVDAHQDLTGATTMAAHPPVMFVHQVLTSMESSVSHTLHVKTEESGTILLVNVSVQQEPFPMVQSVFDVLLVNFTLVEDATAQMEHSLMEFNVLP